MSSSPVGPDAIHAEMERCRRALRALADSATATELHRDSNGTRWSNEQLLFHMVFGFMIVRALLPLVRLFGRLPEGASRGYARLLNSATRPFHLVNYLGSCAGATVFKGPRLTAKMDRTIGSLHRQLDRETEQSLRRVMHFPVGWDPFFEETMTVADVYHYATLHFDFHRRQLTLDRPPDEEFSPER